MKVLTAIIITVLLLPNGVSSQLHQSGFTFLEQYNGQYPYTVKLMDNQKVKHAFISLMGLSRYNFIKTNCGVENPIEVKDGIFSASACQAHNCSDTNFILVINIAENKVYAGIRDNSKVTLYPSGVSGIPQINKWLGN